MNSRNLSILVVFLIFVVFTGCKKATPSFVLKEIGPVKTKTGQAFNVQPNGQAAMWIRAENATKTTVILWGEIQLNTTFGSPNYLTALVPTELYSKPGRFNICLLDTKTSAKSNSLIFTIEE